MADRAVTGLSMLIPPIRHTAGRVATSSSENGDAFDEDRAPRFGGDLRTCRVSGSNARDELRDVQRIEADLTERGRTAGKLKAFGSTCQCTRKIMNDNEELAADLVIAHFNEGNVAEFVGTWLTGDPNRVAGVVGSDSQPRVWITRSDRVVSDDWVPLQSIIEAVVGQENEVVNSFSLRLFEQIDFELPARRSDDGSVVKRRVDRDRWWAGA